MFVIISIGLLINATIMLLGLVLFWYNSKWSIYGFIIVSFIVSACMIIKGMVIYIYVLETVLKNNQLYELIYKSNINISIGVISGVLIGLSTYYFTSGTMRPVYSIV